MKYGLTLKDGIKQQVRITESPFITRSTGASQ
jgi:hypothetical protein